LRSAAASKAAPSILAAATRIANSPFGQNPRAKSARNVHPS